MYIGLEKSKGFQFQLPTFRAGGRKDVLFFTQELSTLLNAFDKRLNFDLQWLLNCRLQFTLCYTAHA